MLEGVARKEHRRGRRGAALDRLADPAAALLHQQERQRPAARRRHPGAPLQRRPRALPDWPSGEPANVFDPVAAVFYYVPGRGSGWRRESYDVRSLPPDPDDAAEVHVDRHADPPRPLVVDERMGPRHGKCSISRRAESLAEAGSLRSARTPRAVPMQRRAPGASSGRASTSDFAARASSSGTSVVPVAVTSVHRPSRPPTGSSIPRLLGPLFHRLIGCSALRQIARELGLTHSSLQRQSERLGRHCLLVLEALRPRGAPPRAPRPRRLPHLRAQPVLGPRPQPPGRHLALRLRLQRRRAAPMRRWKSGPSRRGCLSQ